MPTYETMLPTGEAYEYDAVDDVEAKTKANGFRDTYYGGGQDPQFNAAFGTAPDSAANQAATVERPELAAAMDERIHGEADTRGAVANVANAALMDTGDEFWGVFGGLVTLAQGKGFNEGYDKLAGAIRGDIHNYEERYPNAALAGKLAGGAATAFLPGGAAVRGASLLGKVGRGIAAGAAYGGTQGFAAGEDGVENRLISGGIGAGLGGTIGGAIAPVGAAIGKAVGNRAGRAATPTSEAWEAASSALYKRADDAGVQVMPAATQRLAKVRQDLGAAISDPNIPPEEFRSLYPNSITSLGMLDRIAGKGLSLRNVESYRRTMLDAVMDAADGSADERIASIALRKFDDWVKNIHSSEFSSGAPGLGFGGGKISGAEARQLYVDARRMWKIKAKAQTIERAVQRAENATIQEPGNAAKAAAISASFRRMLNNEHLMAGFDDAEKAAITAAAGGKTSQKVLRGIDLISPGFSMGRLGQSGGWAAATALGLPAPIAGALTVAGPVSRVLRNRSIIKAGNRASLPTRAGGQNPFNANRANVAEVRADRIANAATQPAAQQLRGPIGEDVLDLGSISERGVPARYVPR